MKALDTNIIVRFLVRDDEKQAQAVYKFFKDTQDSQGILFVPLAVVFETIWVLESVYNISREEVIETLKNLLSMPILKFESQPAIQAFVSSAMTSSVDMSDLLIAQSAHHWGCQSVLTLDKKASKSDLFELL